MIQELLGGESGGSRFPPLSSSTPILITTPITSTTPPPPPPKTPSTSSKDAGNDKNSEITKNNHSSQNKNDNNNLRCPRCDSTNTKFCYYNNYNLTQPRHFCKTCRRYWTKGGTLRNVPIGGGCRKNKTAMSANSSHHHHHHHALAKAKAALSTEILLNGLSPPGLLDPFHPGPGPTLWPPTIPHGRNTSSSHILSLLRGATQFPNPNPNPNPNPSPNLNLGSDSYEIEAPSLLGSYGGNGSNILELYHKWKSSGSYNNYYCHLGSENNENNVGIMLGNSLNSGSLEDAATGESYLGGYGGGAMNSSFSSCWSEFPTVPINGTFP